MVAATNKRAPVGHLSLFPLLVLFSIRHDVRIINSDISKLYQPCIDGAALLRAHLVLAGAVDIRSLCRYRKYATRKHQHLHIQPRKHTHRHPPLAPFSIDTQQLLFDGKILRVVKERWPIRPKQKSMRSVDQQLRFELLCLLFAGGCGASSSLCCCVETRVTTET